MINGKDIKISQKGLLKKGKIKNLGMFENIKIRHKGKIDGKNNLPKETKDGDWTAPFLNSNISMLEEFYCQLWGTAQINLEPYYSRLGELMDQVQRIQEQIVKVQRPEVNDINKRYHGEEHLDETQVTRRRHREKNRKNEAYRKKISGYEAEELAALEELERLYNYVIEVNNSYRLIAQRVRRHVELRINTYWDQAYKFHSKKDGMPVFPPKIDESDDIENRYVIVTHRQLEKEASEMLERKRKMERMALGANEDKEVA